MDREVIKTSPGVEKLETRMQVKGKLWIKRVRTKKIDKRKTKGKGMKPRIRRKRRFVYTV